MKTLLFSSLCLVLSKQQLQVNAFQLQKVQRSQVQLWSSEGDDADSLIREAKTILYSAAETKSEDSDKVVGALLDLEKLMRQKNKQNEAQMQETVRLFALAEE
jgi:hypothetical protein